MGYYFEFLAKRLITIKPAPNTSSVEGSGTVSVGEAPSVSVIQPEPPSDEPEVVAYEKAAVIAIADMNSKNCNHSH